MKYLAHSLLLVVIVSNNAEQLPLRTANIDVPQLERAATVQPSKKLDIMNVEPKVESSTPSPDLEVETTTEDVNLAYLTLHKVQKGDPYVKIFDGDMVKTRRFVNRQWRRLLMKYDSIGV